MTLQLAIERIRKRQPVGFRRQFSDGWWCMEIHPREERAFLVTVFRTPMAGPEVQLPAAFEAFLIDIAKAFEGGGYTFDRLRPGVGRN